MSPQRHALAALLLLVIPGVALAEEDYRSEPVRDVELEARLTRTSEFTARAGDSLVDLARLLYGHSTWWVRLRRENPGLAGYAPTRRLPAGTRVRHQVPEIGAEYVVRPGDWLVRIAIWKYGSFQQWSEILEKNKASISKKGLIMPGNRLVFGQDGSIFNASTREVLVVGVEGELFEEARILASLAQQEETLAGWASRHHRRNIIAACTGLALLVLSFIGYVRS